MSAPLPAGPELDAAVARALGWRGVRVTCDLQVRGVPPGDLRTTDVPQWSIDDLCRAVLMHADDVSMETWSPTDGGKSWKAVAHTHLGRERRFAVGETLRLALARLVVAVAEAAKEAKP